MQSRNRTIAVTDDAYAPEGDFKAPAPKKRGQPRRSARQARLRVHSTAELGKDTATVSYWWDDGKQYDETQVSRTLLAPNYDDG